MVDGSGSVAAPYVEVVGFALAAARVQIEPGVSSVTASVSVRWALQ